MSEIDIDVSDLVSALNSQIASYNLELQIAKLQIQSLKQKIEDLEDNSHAKSGSTYLGS